AKHFFSPPVELLQQQTLRPALKKPGNLMKPALDGAMERPSLEKQTLLYISYYKEIWLRFPKKHALRNTPVLPVCLSLAIY
ncbi:hypothetical protein, partial [Sunxiuqinia rutila]|uniref:hypothetical protein n=1 Tax=Sunxiuqinia rutila TaxID=1397841 RepID=UPI003D36B9AA